jgi:hypothetical protein
VTVDGLDLSTNRANFLAAFTVSGLAGLAALIGATITVSMKRWSMLVLVVPARSSTKRGLYANWRLVHCLRSKTNIGIKSNGFQLAEMSAVNSDRSARSPSAQFGLCLCKEAATPGDLIYG